MSVSLDISIRRTELVINSTQLYYAAGGVPYWAESTLVSNIEKPGKNDQNIDKMPQSFAPINQGGIMVSGTIQDAQALFNLNNLNKKTALPQFSLLLRAVDPQMTEAKAKNIAEAVSDWVKFQSTVKSSSQYTEAYAKMTPPYQAAYRPMTSPSELRLVSGITPKLYEELKPYVIALPPNTKKDTKININTAPAQVLMTLGAGISLQQAKALVSIRKSLGGFKNLEELEKNESFKQLNIPDSSFTLQSEYFLASAHVSRGIQHLTLYTLLQREQVKKKWQVHTLWQAQGDY
jgi:general secretion pathway protein K